MIPLDIRREAERRLILAKIAATPSPARFRRSSFSVLFAEPAKAREMKLAGYGASYTGQVTVALPLGEKPPESEKDTIDVQDYSGATHTYTVATVTPLLGRGCYQLGLRARTAKQARTATPGL